MVEVLDDDSPYDVVDGRKEVKTMSVYENVIAGVLYRILDQFVFTSRLGRGLVETMFEMAEGGNRRRPDVAYLSCQRWPQSRRPPSTEAWPVVPEIAAEVVSPTNDMKDVLDKVQEYFEAGVQCVWLVLPEHELIYVYSSMTSVRILSRADELTDETILPGFRLPLGDLFPLPDPEPALASPQ